MSVKTVCSIPLLNISLQKKYGCSLVSSQHQSQVMAAHILTLLFLVLPCLSLQTTVYDRVIEKRAGDILLVLYMFISYYFFFCQTQTEYLCTLGQKITKLLLFVKTNSGKTHFRQFSPFLMFLFFLIFFFQPIPSENIDFKHFIQKVTLKYV